MRLDDIDAKLRESVFEFFYWFSRFEFALKENRFLKSTKIGAPAEPCWDDFVKKHKDAYSLSKSAADLIAENPKKQVVGNVDLPFVQVKFDDQPTQLGKVVKLLKTVRNNLFHGGKHGGQGWEDPTRTLQLVTLSVGVLHELAQLGGFEADLTGSY